MPWTPGRGIWTLFGAQSWELVRHVHIQAACQAFWRRNSWGSWAGIWVLSSPPGDADTPSRGRPTDVAGTVSTQPCQLPSATIGIPLRWASYGHWSQPCLSTKKLGMSTVSVPGGQQSLKGWQELVLRPCSLNPQMCGWDGASHFSPRGHGRGGHRGNRPCLCGAPPLPVWLLSSHCPDEALPLEPLAVQSGKLRWFTHACTEIRTWCLFCSHRSTGQSEVLTS